MSEIAEIRARHISKHDDPDFSEADGYDAHNDRWTLLRALDEAQARAERAEAALRPFVHAHDLHIRDDDADTMKPAIVQTGYFRIAAQTLKERHDG